jgi:hypothetical protein
MKISLLLATFFSIFINVFSDEIPNSDFSQYTSDYGGNFPSHWSKFGNGSVSLLLGCSPTGSNCVEFVYAGSIPTGLSGEIFRLDAQNASQQYTLSFAALTSLTAGQAQVIVEFFDNNDNQIGYDIASNLTGSSTWKNYSKVYNTSLFPTNTQKVRICLKLNYGGWKCYFANLSFRASFPIQDQLNNGGTVVLPDGVTALSEKLQFVKPNTKLTGSKNSVLRFVGTNMTDLFYINQQNCEISGFTIEGPNSSSCSYINDCIGIYVLKTEGFLIKDCVLNNMIGQAIRFNNVSSSRIENCTFKNFGQNGILLVPDDNQIGCSNITITNCFFPSNQHAVQDCIYASLAQKTEPTCGSKNIIITNNILQTDSDWGIEIGDINIDGGRGIHSDIIVANNVVMNTRGAGIGFRSVYKGTITNNRLRNCGGHSYGGDAIYATGENRVCKYISIIGNSITMATNTYDLFLGNRGIHVSQYDGVNISNNFIDTASVGIELEGSDPAHPRTFKNCVILGNQIHSANVGIFVNSVLGYENINITENSIIDPINFGIFTGGVNCQYVSVKNNIVRNSGSSVTVPYAYRINNALSGKITGNESIGNFGTNIDTGGTAISPNDNISLP